MNDTHHDGWHSERTTVRGIVKAVLPRRIYRTLVHWYWRLKPSPLDSFRRVRPVSPQFGRGKPIDRYYIESFLHENDVDIHGRVLEIGDRLYTNMFGCNRVTRSDVLHVEPEADGVAGRQTTIVGDLATGAGIPEGVFDCLILTQTLHCIFDIGDAIESAHRALRNGGVLLATFPGITQVSRYDLNRWGEYWRFTDLAIRKLFDRHFPASQLTIESFGNVLSATALLHGLAAHELRKKELDYRDPDFPVTIGVRAVRSVPAL